MSVCVCFFFSQKRKNFSNSELNVFAIPLTQIKKEIIQPEKINKYMFFFFFKNVICVAQMTRVILFYFFFQFGAKN
jgi:hypothetical protein